MASILLLHYQKFPVGENEMGQEVSASYQAVKSRVYRLIDSLVEGAKTEQEVQESMQRWWKLVHPADRPMAKKYLTAVLAKSNATLGAISDGMGEFKEFSSAPEIDLSRSSKIRAAAAQSHASAM